jgi:hypothetical protein
MKLVENDGMTDSPQDIPNVVYIIVSRNETFGHDTYLIFLVRQRLSLKRYSVTHFVMSNPGSQMFDLEEIRKRIAPHLVLASEES